MAKLIKENSLTVSKKQVSFYINRGGGGGGGGVERKPTTMPKP